MFLKKSDSGGTMKTIGLLVFVFSAPFLLVSCKNTVAPADENIQVEISSELLADQLGDKNGKASVSEMNFVEDFFNNHNEMWLLTNCICTECESVKSNMVKEKFFAQSQPFASTEELRNSFAGLSIKTPWVGVAKLGRRNSIFILKVYRAPGPNFSSSGWEEIRIVR